MQSLLWTKRRSRPHLLERSGAPPPHWDGCKSFSQVIAKNQESCFMEFVTHSAIEGQLGFEQLCTVLKVGYPDLYISQAHFYCLCVCVCVCCVCAMEIAIHNISRKHCVEAVSRESDLGSHTSSNMGLGLH